jgi:hypothetical protein
VRYRIVLLLASALLLAGLAPARAEGRWSLGFFAGESVSERHGSALDARALARVHPLLGLGIETGVAYMNDQYREAPVFALSTDGPGRALASLTDGITRNRGFYLGPTVKVGDVLYAIASMGLYEFSDNQDHVTSTRWGASAGLGISGRARFEPTAELRYRRAQDAGRRADAIQFTVGLHIQ